MNFELREDQILLRDSIGGYLKRYYSHDLRRASLEAGWRPEVWDGFVQQLGLLGATIPEAQGGLGGGAVEAMIIAEELGRALVIEPYPEWVTLAVALLSAADESAADLLRGIAEGTLRIAPALYEAAGRFSPGTVETRGAGDGGTWGISGTKTGVAGACGATHLLLSARTGGSIRDSEDIVLALVALDAPGIERLDYALIDGRRAADFTLDNAPARLIHRGPRTLALIERGVDHATVALCAEAVGVMETALDLTVAYAKQREQFGQPIARFQVLQHRLADMQTRIELSRSLTIMATLSLAAPDGERQKAVSAAKAFVSDAARFVGQGAVQIHGGIGTTDELAVSHYFKRATVIESQFGSAAFHLKRMGKFSNLPA